MTDRPEALRLVSDATHNERRNLMSAGEFWHFHTWESADGHALEYWRGVGRNGACVRRLFNQRMVSITHHPEPARALQALEQEGCKVPVTHATA